MCIPTPLSTVNKPKVLYKYEAGYSLQTEIPVPIPDGSALKLTSFIPGSIQNCNNTIYFETVPEGDCPFLTSEIFQGTVTIVCPKQPKKRVIMEAECKECC